jgi:hypothetical protein
MLILFSVTLSATAAKNGQKTALNTFYKFKKSILFTYNAVQSNFL